MRKILSLIALLALVSAAAAERVLITPQASFTRPSNTTAYVSGQLVANNTAAASVTPMTFAVSNQAGGQPIYVRRATASATSTGVTGANFRLHLFDTSPTVTNGDGASYLASPEQAWFCDIDINFYSSLPFSAGTGNAGIGVPNTGSECGHVPPTTNIFGLLEARGAYQPSSGEVFTVTLEVYYP